MAENWRKLIEVLLKSNIVKKKTVNDAILRYRSTGEAVEKVLVTSGLVTRDQLLEAKREAFGVETYDLDPSSVDPSVGHILPQSMADRYGVVCVDRKKNTLTLVSTEPLDAIAMDYLRMRSGFEIRFRLAYAVDLDEARHKIYTAQATVPHVRTPPPRSDVAFRSRSTFQEVAPQREKNRKTVQLPELEVKSTRHGPSSPRTVRGGPAVPAAGVKKGVHASQVGKAEAPRVVALTPKASCELCTSLTEVTRSTNTREQLEKILQTVRNACDCEAASLLVLEEDGRSLFFKHAVGGRSDEILNIIVPLNEASVAGWVLGHRKPLMVNNTEADPMHNKETDKMLQFATHRVAAAPVLLGDILFGVVEAVNKKLGSFNEDDVEVLGIASAQIAVVLHNERTAAQLSGLVMETVNVLAELLQLQGKVSRRHLVDVAQMSTAMGREVGLDEAQMEILAHAGMLHDVGALAPDPDDDQTAHCRRGAELLLRFPMLANLVPCIRMHHERWDGKGPHRLREIQIPLPARILSIAEAWYESPGDGLDVFVSRFGTDFDPSLEDAFLKAHRTISQARGEAPAS